MSVKEEIKEIKEILKKHGLSRDEQRTWVTTIRKEAKLK